MYNIIPDLNEIERTRFWKRVDKESTTNRSQENPDLYSHVEGNCWEWTGWIRSDKDPYGRLRINKKTYDAHRVAYKLQHGEDPGELLVCHHCDNPRCVRYNHIYLGDRLQNSKDRRDRDRMNLNPAKGEKAGCAVLTESQVIEIFNRYHSEDTTCDTLAQEYNVHSLTISRILRGDNWSYLNLTQKGTSNKRTGERSPSAKLTKEQVIEIFIRRFRDKESGPKLAKEFGVDNKTIYAILKGRTWKSVTDSIAI